MFSLKKLYGLVVFSLLLPGLTGCQPEALTPEPTIPVTSPTLKQQTATTTPSATALQPTSTATFPAATATSATATLSPTVTPPPTATATIILPTATPTQAITVSPPAQLTPTMAPVLTETLSAITTLPAICCPDCNCSIKHVVIISVDGLRPEALEQANTPVFDALRLGGAYSPTAQTTLPSVTLGGHASMLSGMDTVKHGLDWNDYLPKRGKINGPTLFSVAHTAGLQSSMIVAKPRLQHIILPGSVDKYIYGGATDRQVVEAATEVIKDGLPDLLFIHLPDVDSEGHVTGWLSPTQLRVVSRTDAFIGRLIASLQENGYLAQTLLLITSDHGGLGKKHGSDHPAEMTIPWLAFGPTVPPGLNLQQEIVVYDTAATALYAFGLPIPDSWDGQPVLEIFGEAAPQ